MVVFDVIILSYSSHTITGWFEHWPSAQNSLGIYQLKSTKLNSYCPVSVTHTKSKYKLSWIIYTRTHDQTRGKIHLPWQRDCLSIASVWKSGRRWGLMQCTKYGRTRKKTKQKPCFRRHVRSTLRLFVCLFASLTVVDRSGLELTGWKKALQARALCMCLCMAGNFSFLCVWQGKWATKVTVAYVM